MKGKIFFIAALMAMAAVTPPISRSGAASYPEVELAQAAYRRDPSDTSRYLGEIHSDDQKGYSIRPPAQWYKVVKGSRFDVKFSSQEYDAFIMVNHVDAEGEIKIDREFSKFIKEKNQAVKERVPSMRVLSDFPGKIGGVKGWRTEMVFQAGSNRILMNVYYVPHKNRLWIITTMCPELNASRKWVGVISASVDTFRAMN